MKKWQLIILLVCFVISSCSRRTETQKVFNELCFVDHQNLRYISDKETTLFQVHEIKKNMDKAAEFGVDTYLFFAKETFEAMLDYDFEVNGIGNIGQKAFPVDGEHRRIVNYLRPALKEVLAYAKDKKLRVFFHSNQFIFPTQILEIIRPTVWGTAICPGRAVTWEIYRKKLHEFLKKFPEIAGFQVTGDETQVSVFECHCDSCRHLKFIDRVNLLTIATAKVCEEHGKEVQMRTWQRMGELEAEVHPSRMGDGLPKNVFFSIKNTRGDFQLINPADEVFLKAVDPERVVVEFDAWREYNGNNYFPCYMGDIWAPRFKLISERGVKRIAVRLNWNSNKNQIFEHPWGNVVNVYAFLKLAQQPDCHPDDVLRAYIAENFPETAQEAAFKMYKFSPEFQKTIYYIHNIYCANHSKVQDEDAEKNLEAIQQKGFLITPEHFQERKIEIQNVCDQAMAFIQNLGPDFPENLRSRLIDGMMIERLVSLGTIYKMEAIYWKKQQNLHKFNEMKELIKDLQYEWNLFHPESYLSMNGKDISGSFE